MVILLWPEQTCVVQHSQELEDNNWNLIDQIIICWNQNIRQYYIYILLSARSSDIIVKDSAHCKGRDYNPL